MSNEDEDPPPPEFGDFVGLPDFLCDNDEIDRMIEERAGAFNLTGTNIRNILYHVVLGVGGARDFWDTDEQDFLSPIEIPEPKTRAAKQKLLGQEAGGQSSNAPLLTLPEVRSPEHEHEEDEDEDYIPQDTEGSEDSDDEQESQAPTTPKSIIMTPSSKHARFSECDSEPATPSTGLARRTRSLFSLKDRDLVELESALPEDDVKDDEDEEDKGDKIGEAAETEAVVAIEDTPIKSSVNEPEENWDGLEAELENEFDNLTEEESPQSSEDEGDAADDGTFGKFLKGIVNPREEFPEEDSMIDSPYMYREKMRFEPEEFRTDKDVKVTKKEMEELYRDLELAHPDVNEQLNSRCRHRKLTSEVVAVVEGPLFTQQSLDVLKEQLQMHLQLLVQHTILTSGVESLSKNKAIAWKRIEELEALCSHSSTEGLLQAMEGNSDEPQSITKCLDIYPALRLAQGVKYTADVTPSEPIPQKVAREVSHIKHIEPLPRNKYYLLNYQPFFHKFHHLRPTVNFICQTKIKPNANRCFTELEDNLLAHGLDAFKCVKEQKVVYQCIRDYFLPTKTAKQISIRVKNRMSSQAPYNVIKHWKDTGFICYDTHYTTTKLMKSLSVPVTSVQRIAPAVKRENLDWLVALRDHRRKLQRDYSKRRQKLNCTKNSVLSAAKLATTNENHGFEIAFLLKAKEVLKNDYTTYFNVFKTLAEYNQTNEFDCEEVVTKILHLLSNYPDLRFEFLSIFCPLPDLPIEQLLETLNHMKTRLLLRNLERHFKNNPSQYKKVIKMILGANLKNPTATRDTLLSMLRGKPQLSDQVTEFFDKCAIKPKANDFEYIDLTVTDKNTSSFPNPEGFEEISLLEKTSASTQKHNKLIASINKFHDEQRKQELEDKLESKRKEEETKRLLQLEKRKMPARNVVECGNKVLTWTREQDRELLRACRANGPRSKIFKALAKSFPHKTDSQVKDRFFTLMQLMKKAQKAAERKAKKSSKTPIKQSPNAGDNGTPIKQTPNFGDRETPSKPASSKGTPIKITSTTGEKRTPVKSLKRPRLTDQQAGPSAGVDGS